MATFWFVDGAEGLNPGTTMANIGRWAGVQRTANVAGASAGGLVLPTSRHNFGQMYGATDGGNSGVMVPYNLRAINIAAAVYRNGNGDLLSVSTNGSPSAPGIRVTAGILYATGLNASNTPIGTWIDNTWIHLEIGFYYEDINEGGNGSGYARYYVNGALMHTRTYDSSFANLIDYLGITGAGSTARIIDDVVVRGSSISGFQTQIGDVRVETFVAPSLGNADGDTTFDTISGGSESAYGVTVSPVGSVGGSFRATVVEAIAKKGESSEPVYVKPRIIGVTPYGNQFGEAAADGTYISYSSGGDYVTVGGAESIGVLVDTVP
jgi:hypothetical protein